MTDDSVPDVVRYYREAIETHDGSSVMVTELYDDYCSWCDSKNKEPAVFPSFAREFAEIGVDKEKVSGRVRYIGIALKSDMAMAAAHDQPRNKRSRKVSTDTINFAQRLRIEECNLAITRMMLEHDEREIAIWLAAFTMQLKRLSDKLLRDD